MKITTATTANTIPERQTVETSPSAAAWPSVASASITSGDVYYLDATSRSGMRSVQANADVTRAVAGQLAGLASLPRGWDSYGASPIDERVSLLALHFLVAVLEQGLPRPFVVPTTHGGISIEWHRASRELIVGIEPGRPQPSAFFADDAAGLEWEAELPGEARFIPALVAMDR